MASNSNELRFLVPWEIRDLLPPADRELYIAEYTLCGRDFFTALCMECFRHNLIGGPPNVHDPPRPSQQDIYKSEQLEKHLMTYYNSPLVQTKYLIFNMIRQESHMHMIARGKHKIVLRAQITGGVIDPTHVTSDPDIRQTSASNKHLVNHLMGPPAVRNTSPAVTSLALMFSKQLHTQYSYIGIQYRVAVLLQATEPDSLEWKWLMSSSQTPPAVNRNINAVCDGVIKRARDILTAAPGSVPPAQINGFNLLRDAFVFFVYDPAKLLRIGNLSFDYYIRLHPNPIIQYLVRIVDQGVAVEDSSDIFEELMISRAGNINIDDLLMIRNAKHVLTNAVDVIAAPDPTAHINAIYNRIATHRDRFAGLYNEYAQVFLDYYRDIKGSDVGKHHLRTADPQTSIEIIYQ